MELPPADVPEPDMSLEPAGYVVTGEDGDRIHFLDWGGPAEVDPSTTPGVVAVHGLAATGWAWAPVARRIGGPHGRRHVVAMDLRGHGLSDAPTDDGAYGLDVQAEDVVAVAEGAGLLAAPADRVVLAGHGFGAIVVARAAAALGERCAGLVLVDGGWEDLEAATGVDVDEFLRGLDEPPEVMRSLGAFLADRRAFDPSSWDDDQDRAARSSVVETHAGRVVPSARPHATEASVRAMFDYEPAAALAEVPCPVTALLATTDDAGARARMLADVSARREGAGRSPISSTVYEGVGHNLMRYRPSGVAEAILVATRQRPTA